MKPWKPLLALVCLAFAVSSASAAVVFKGLSYTASGACVADVDADGRLVLSNIGSSGQDGVSIWSPRGNGARVVIDGSCTAADAGSSLSLVHSVSLNGLPPGTPVLRSLSVTFSVQAGDAVSPPRCACRADFSEVSSSATQTVVLYRGGVVVYVARDYDKASPVILKFADAASANPNPVLSVSSQGKSSPKLCEAVCSFSSTVQASVGGVDVDCDAIAFRCLSDNDCDGVGSQLVVSATPGGSFSSVHCSDGSCKLFGHWVSGAGAASLDLDTFASSAGRRLPVNNLGSSGQDGVSVRKGGEQCDDGNPTVGDGCSSDASMACVFSPPSLDFSSAADIGASATFSARYKLFSLTGAPGAVGEAHAKVSRAGDTMSGLLFSCDHTGLGAAAESVIVLSNGVVVGHAVLPPAFSVQVLATPGGAPFVPVVSLGIHHEPAGNVTLIKGPMLANRAGLPAATLASSTTSGGGAPMEVSFASSRVFVVGGTPVTGDELVCVGVALADVRQNIDELEADMLVSSPSPSSSLGSLAFADFSSVGQDEIFADASPATALSSAHTCVTVPVVFARTDATPVRAFSVTFHLSPELAACGAGVVEGDYLSSVSNTQMFVRDNGGGSYTVDCGILGPVCGATGNGRLFTVDLGAVMPPASSAGAVTVDAVTVRDCSNAPVVAHPGPSAIIPIQFTAPPALSGLAAVQVKTGNGGLAGGGGGGTTAISVTFPALSSSGSTLELFRKGFGHYPEYDNGSGPGSVPVPPASSSVALSSGWAPVSCSSTCSSGACTSTCTPTSVLDSPPNRDYFYYVAFVRDVYGNESPVSNMTTGTLDYHLGDVSDGTSLCVGDDHVSLPDISFLGAHYGTAVPPGSPFTCLDVGPTLDYSVDTRPTTDAVVDFEDFMMFAINWSVVSAPRSAVHPAATGLNASQLVVPALPPAGGTFDADVVVDGAGNVQGVSVQLAYDHDVLEQVGVAPGELLGRQDRTALVLSSGPGKVDAALLGTGPGIAGHGELARVTFRVKSPADPQLAIASITGRDQANHAVAIAGATGGTTVSAHTALGFAFPNPFHESVTLQFTLHRSGTATVGIYDVAGRRVRTLVRGVQPAGAQAIAWDGRDDAGLRLAPGAYIVRLEADELRESRTIRLVR